MPSHRASQASEVSPALRGYGVVLVLLFVMVVVVAAVLLSGEARHQLSLSFMRQPERYVELYFSDDLPIEFNSGPDRIGIKTAFTIVNHEGDRARFPYLAQVVNEANAPLGQVRGSVEIPNGSSFTTVVVVDIAASESWSAIEIVLEGRNEHIRFLQPE